MAEIKVRKVSWQEIDSFIDTLSRSIASSGYKPDALISLVRGGLIPAGLLSDKLDVKRVYAMQTEHYTGLGEASKEVIVIYDVSANLEGKKVLLIDDISDAGDTFILAKEHVSKHNMPQEIRTVALQVYENSKFRPDYYAEEKPKDIWISYPWSREEDIKALEKMKRNDDL